MNKLVTQRFYSYFNEAQHALRIIFIVRLPFLLNIIKV